MIIAEIEHFKS